eukprot:1259124-Amphidinium_carterae.3
MKSIGGISVVPSCGMDVLNLQTSDYCQPLVVMGGHGEVEYYTSGTVARGSKDYNAARHGQNIGIFS